MVIGLSLGVTIQWYQGSKALARPATGRGCAAQLDTLFSVKLRQ